MNALLLLALVAAPPAVDHANPRRAQLESVLNYWSERAEQHEANKLKIRDLPADAWGIYKERLSWGERYDRNLTRRLEKIRSRLAQFHLNSCGSDWRVWYVQTGAIKPEPVLIVPPKLDDEL